MAVKKLDVPFVNQYEGHFCGPACAQMILLARGRVDDDSHDVQTTLFETIKTNTPGGHPLVEQCGGARSLTWETFPHALEATMNRRIRRNRYTVHADADARINTARAVRGVSAEHASAALVEDSTHWMVVYGWEERRQRRRLPALPVDGRQITHLFIHDPNWGFPSLIDVELWTSIQYKVDCGTFDGRFVVVSAP